MSGGELGNLKEAELDAWMIQHLLQYGITPQMWHPDYKSLDDKLKPSHRHDIVRLRNWRTEAQNKK